MIGLADKSSLGCLVRPDGNILISIAVKNGGDSLNFKTERSKTSRLLKNIKKKIRMLKKELRTLKQKRQTKQLKSQIKNLLKQLDKQNASQKNLTLLLIQIQSCESGQISETTPTPTNTPTSGSACGNGVVESGETCDGNCPSTCPQIGCALTALSGSASTCSAVCTNAGTINQCVPGDGCCPSGCNANNDSDCKATCGNAIIESNEACDQTNFGGKSCQTLGYSAGSLTCSSSCQIVETGCFCAAGLSRCGSACVDTSNNKTNCGSCGTVCAGAQVCVNSICRAPPPVCDVGKGDCDFNSANGCEATLSSDVLNCGQCTNACSSNHGTAQCSSGTCRISCAPNFGNCDFNSANGCETQTNTIDNCGACGKVCAGAAHASPLCSNGQCKISCAAGWSDCDADPANGCETNIADDVSNCGVCGKTCVAAANAAPACANGSCGLGACNSGFDNCDGNATNGCEASLNSVTSCGACGSTCPGAAHGTNGCSGGFCVLSGCENSWGNCDGSFANGCETSLLTNSDCNGCGVICSKQNAVTSCATGSCQKSACLPGFCDADSNGSCEKSLTTAVSCENSGLYLGTISGNSGQNRIELNSFAGDQWLSLDITDDDGFFGKNLLALANRHRLRP